MTKRLIPFLFIVGVFTPTSVASQMTDTFSMIACFILLISLILILIIQNHISIFSLITLVASNILLWFFTLIAPYSEYSFGTSIYFLIFTLILCLDFRKIETDMQSYLKALQFINIGQIFLSFGVLFRIEPIMNIITNWYSAFYPELIQIMIYDNSKPIGTFATHSIAGFYYFIFFFVNISIYHYLKKKSYLVFSLVYMILLLYLQSSTSLVYFLFCFLVLTVFLYKKSKSLFFLIFITSLITLVIKFEDITIFQNITDKLFSTSNGFSSRYSTVGVLSNSINYIKDNPFRGVGFSFSPNFNYVDSGIVEYTLRGSILLLKSMLVGFYLLLKRNIKKTFAFLFFILFLSFEFGFSNFIYFRSLFIIPFVVAIMSQIIAYNKKENSLSK